MLSQNPQGYVPRSFSRTQTNRQGFLGFVILGVMIVGFGIFGISRSWDSQTRLATVTAHSPEIPTTTALQPSVSEVPALVDSLDLPSPLTTEESVVPAVPQVVNVPVLMYHYIREVTDPADKLGFRLSVTPIDFRAQMEYLAQQSYTTVTPNEISETLAGRRQLPEKSILLTFDDGYADFYSQAFPTLKELNLKVTLYVVSGFVGRPDGQYVSWEQIREMDQSGIITIGAHTMTHADLTRVPTARDEIVRSKEELEARLGHPVMSFAYPGGRHNYVIDQMVREAGYELAFTTEPGKILRPEEIYTLPRVRVSGGETIEQFIRSL